MFVRAFRKVRVNAVFLAFLDFGRGFLPLLKERKERKDLFSEICGQAFLFELCKMQAVWSCSLMRQGWVDHSTIGPMTITLHRYFQN